MIKHCVKGFTHPIVLLLVVLFIKLYAFQVVVFENTSFFHVLLVEFPMWALVFSALMIFFKKRTWLAIWLYQLFLSILFIVVVYYTRYFSTVPSYYDVKQIYQSNSVGGTVALLGSPYDYLFFLDVVLVLPLIWFFKKNSTTFVSAKRYAMGFGCLGLIMTVIAFRYPLIDVSYFAKKHGYIQSQFVQAYENSLGTAFASQEYMSEKELEKLKGNTYVPAKEHSTFGMAKNRHVFIIQVESLQEFTINQKVNGQEITPNLNALLKDSAYFDNVYQQIGAGNTSDAEWLMHTSLYPEGMDPTVNTLEVEGKEIPSLVWTLKKNGYGTATYHADDITYWSRDKLYPALGFDYIYTSKEIPNEKEIGFGPADEVLFNFVEEELAKQLKNHEKMYSNIITLTSHTPFEMPEEYKLLDLPENYKETYVGNYFQAVRYTDEQIGLFIQKLKKLGIYNESVILIYGDHSGLHGAPVTENDKLLLKDVLGHKYNLQDRFIVPVLFTAPGLFNGETYSHLGGQIDLMPTLLNLLGIEHETQMMGHNLFHYKKNLLGMRYYLPGGSFISDKTFYTAPSAKLPASIYDRASMKKIKNTNRLQKRIDNTLSIMEYSDYIRKEQTEE